VISRDSHEREWPEFPLFYKEKFDADAYIGGIWGWGFWVAYLCGYHGVKAEMLKN
jgi:hypothetical protein